MIELLIGRESGAEKPRLAVTRNGKTDYYGKPGSVPRSVSRRHCRVTVDDDLSVTIEDITENNFMFVNGSDCKRRKNLRMDERIELGPDHYVLELDAIIKGLSAQQTWHIAHLEKIYNDYHQTKMDNQIEQGKKGAIMSLPGIISMISIAVAASVPNVRTPMIIVAAVFAIVFAIIRMRDASIVPLKLKKLDEDFRESYVCPNPTCGRFLGAMTYKDLLKNRVCPYCKAKYIE